MANLFKQIEQLAGPATQGDDEEFKRQSNWAHRVDRAISVLMAHGTFRDRPTTERRPRTQHASPQED